MVELVGSFYRILDKLAKGTDVRLLRVKNSVKSISSVIIIYIFWNYLESYLHKHELLVQASGFCNWKYFLH